MTVGIMVIHKVAQLTATALLVAFSETRPHSPYISQETFHCIHYLCIRSCVCGVK